MLKIDDGFDYVTDADLIKSSKGSKKKQITYILGIKYMAANYAFTASFQQQLTVPTSPLKENAVVTVYD